MAAIQMLNELNRLKEAHGSRKAQLKGAAIGLQPTLQQQREMIVRNVSNKLVSMAMKRETTKFIFDQRMKIQDELRRKEEESSVAASDTKPSEAHKGRPSTVPNKRGSFMQSDRRIVPLANLGRMRSDLGQRRPQTSVTRQSVGRVDDFVRSIKTSTNAEDFQSELEDQLMHRAKDSTKVFEIVCRSMKMGAVCQFSPRRPHEEIDLSHFNSSSHADKVTKLEDLASFRKKDGMLLFMDPATNTYGHHVTLRVTFMKAVDIGEEQLVSKDFVFWSDGNYYGLKVMRDARSHTGLHALLHDEDNGGTKCSLPGWQGRVPLYIPAPACKIAVLGLEDYGQAASLAYNLSRLRLFAISCANPKAGLKRLQDFLDQQLLVEMANITVTGGLSAMHLAALHGNLEAVQTLVTTGANLNHRCKGDKLLTALHEAVIGGHSHIVRYLLTQGASQIVTDESGRCALHYACQLGHVTITRLLMDAAGGRRALLIEDRFTQKPFDLCATNFLKSIVEAVMRKHKIFKKPRVSIMDRAAS